jgi:hypothetical protein
LLRKPAKGFAPEFGGIVQVVHRRDLHNMDLKQKVEVLC